MSWFAQLGAGVLVFACLGSGSSGAGTVSIGVNPANQKELVVEAQDATIPEILARLQELQPFEIEQSGDYATPGPITRRYTGEFRHVLERVLENENHLVVSSERLPAVERVVIYGGGGNDKTMTVAHAPQAMASASLAAPPAPPPVDPVVQVAMARAKEDAAAAKARGEAFPPEYSSPAPMRRSAANGWGRSGRRGL
jgi:hypothetical protein